jgi:hypothetical protein
LQKILDAIGGQMKKIICTTLFFVFFWSFHTVVAWLSPFSNLLWVFFTWIAIALFSLVASKLIYDWLEHQEKGFLPPKRRDKIFLSMVFFSISIFGIGYWSEYQERPFEDVLDDYSYPKELSLYPTSNNRENIKDTETIREFMDLLSKYDIKKTRKDTWDSVADFEVWWENEKGLRGPAMVMVRIEENEFWINMEHYRVLNGPVDLKWIREHLSTDE